MREGEVRPTLINPRHEPEIPTPALERLPQIRILVLIRINHAPIRQHNLPVDHCIARETVLVAVERVPAARREAAYTDDRRPRSRKRNPMRLEHIVDHSRISAGLDRRDFTAGIVCCAVHVSCTMHSQLIHP